MGDSRFFAIVHVMNVCVCDDDEM